MSSRDVSSKGKADSTTKLNIPTQKAVLEALPAPVDSAIISADPRNIVQLQRLIGNRGVQRLMGQPVSATRARHTQTLVIQRETYDAVVGPHLNGPNAVAAKLATELNQLDWTAVPAGKPTIEFVEASELTTTAQYDSQTHVIKVKNTGVTPDVMLDNLLFEAHNALNRTIMEGAREQGKSNSKTSPVEYGLTKAKGEFKTEAGYIASLRRILTTQGMNADAIKNLIKAAQDVFARVEDEMKLSTAVTPEEKSAERKAKLDGYLQPLSNQVGLPVDALKHLANYGNVTDTPDEEGRFTGTPHDANAPEGTKPRLSSAELYTYEAIEGWENFTKVQNRVNQVVGTNGEAFVQNLTKKLGFGGTSITNSTPGKTFVTAINKLTAEYNIRWGEIAGELRVWAYVEYVNGVVAALTNLKNTTTKDRLVQKAIETEIDRLGTLQLSERSQTVAKKAAGK